MTTAPPPDPEQALAMAYVAAPRRVAIQTLLELDRRIADVRHRMTQSGIAMIRLAWWRDALTALDTAPAPGEPLLHAVQENIVRHGVRGRRLSELPMAWGLVAQPEADPEELANYARGRGGSVFAAAADLLGADGTVPEGAAMGWALADLAFSVADPELAQAAIIAARDAFAGWDGTVAKRMRPLGMLAMLARRDVAAGLVVPRRQGAPGRVARMMRYGLIGR